MFADVEGSTISDEEMDEADGGLVKETFIGAALGAGKNYLQQRFVEGKSHKEIKWEKVGKAAIVGGIGGAIGGYSNIVKSAKRTMKTVKAYSIYKKYGKSSFKVFKKFHK